jgi:hypothetical protein
MDRRIRRLVIKLYRQSGRKVAPEAPRFSFFRTAIEQRTASQHKKHRKRAAIDLECLVDREAVIAVSLPSGEGLLAVDHHAAA